MTSKDLFCAQLLKIKKYLTKQQSKLNMGNYFYFYDVSSLRELPG